MLTHAPALKIYIDEELYSPVKIANTALTCCVDLILSQVQIDDRHITIRPEFMQCLALWYANKAKVVCEIQRHDRMIAMASNAQYLEDFSIPTFRMKPSSDKSTLVPQMASYTHFRGCKKVEHNPVGHSVTVQQQITHLMRPNAKTRTPYHWPVQIWPSLNAPVELCIQRLCQAFINRFLRFFERNEQYGHGECSLKHFPELTDWLVSGRPFAINLPNGVSEEGVTKDEKGLFLLQHTPIKRELIRYEL